MIETTKRATPTAGQPRLESPPGLDPATQLRAWLAVLDAVLVAVEQTAWQAREIGERARQAVLGIEGGVGRMVAGSRALADELSAWPERLARLGSTGLTLTTIATTYRLHTTKAAFLSRTRAARSLEALHEANAKRFYELSVRQGGAFLKVGQMLSARPDLLPAPWIEQLSRLQDAAPPVPFADVRAALEQELGALSDVFASIDETPLGAASIGQVHRARLHDGREVAVKVQRPGVDDLVKLDLDLLELFVRGLAESLPPMDLDTIVAEVRAMIFAELDYVLEAEATECVARFFQGDERIRAPQVVRERSTARVLVTSFMEGEKITKVLDRLKEARAQGDASAQAELTQRMASVLEAYARQVLDLGLFQADPHPGNLLVDDSGTLTLLDFGCAKTLTPAGQAALVALGQALIFNDAERMAKGMQELGFETDSGTLDGLRAYARLVLDEVRRVREKGGGWPDQAEVLAQLTRLSRKIEDDPIVRLPVEMVMLGRVFGTLAGLFLHYAPDASAASSVLPTVLGKLGARA